MDNAQRLPRRLLEGVPIFGKEDIEWQPSAIGNGVYGEVYRGKIKETQQIVAIKKAITEDTERTALEAEARWLSNLNHDNIVKCYGVCIDPFGILTEYINGYTLYSLINNPDKFSYDFSLGLSWAIQCAKGVEYLHSMNPKPIIHRDLKSLNLVVNWSGEVLKIIDFGEATDIRTLMSKNTGTWRWMAPEVFVSNEYTEKCDVYSFGIILWEILNREIPFRGIDSFAAQWQIHKEQRPPVRNIGPEGYEELMQQCWQHEPQSRPTMADVVLKLQDIRRNNPVGVTKLQHLYDCCQSHFSSCSYSHDLNLSERKLDELVLSPPEDLHPKTFEIYKKFATKLFDLYNVPEYKRPVASAKISTETFQMYQEHTKLALESQQLEEQTIKMQERINRSGRLDFQKSKRTPSKSLACN